MQVNYSSPTPNAFLSLAGYWQDYSEFLCGASLEFELDECQGLTMHADWCTMCHGALVELSDSALMIKAKQDPQTLKDLEIALAFLRKEYLLVSKVYGKGYLPYQATYYTLLALIEYHKFLSNNE